jgi:hypothetical protein
VTGAHGGGGQREGDKERARERGREKEGERKRERERERERERKRCPELLFLFLKGMMRALAPFSYLVRPYLCWQCVHPNCQRKCSRQARGLTVVAKQLGKIGVHES